MSLGLAFLQGGGFSFLPWCEQGEEHSVGGLTALSTTLEIVGADSRSSWKGH